MPDFKFLLLRNYIIRHAERMQQLARRIYSPIFLFALLFHRAASIIIERFSPGFDRNDGQRNIYAEYLDILVIEAEAVIDLFVIPRLELNDHIDFLGHFDSAHTEYPAGVYYADAAQLDKVAYIIRRTADERSRRNAANLDRVIRYQSVTALYKLKGSLALADAAVTKDQDTPAADFDKHAVARDALGELDAQI